MPAVSIVMPFKNAADTLQDTLDSIERQTLADYELIAIDDGSEDTGGMLVAEKAKSDIRIRLLNSDNPGLVNALNLGIGHSRSELIARMDADDIMHPERLFRQYRHMTQNPETTVLGTRARVFPETRLQAGYREYMRWQNDCVTREQINDFIYVESPFAHPTVMFRKSTIEAIGAYRDGPFPEDYDLWLRLHQARHTMEKLPDTLVDWRETPGRTSRNDPRYDRLAFEQLKAEYLARDPRIRKNSDVIAIWGAGRKTRKRVHHLLKQGITPLAWVDIDPRKIGNRLHGVPVVAPEWLEKNRPGMILVYVANHGARDDIRMILDRFGYRCGHSYLLVA